MSKIEWLRDPVTGKPGISINPVKGLCPVACKDNQGREYCYARRMYRRFHWCESILFVPAVFHDLAKIPPGSKVFWGSTIELFGSWVGAQWMRLIMNQVANRLDLTHIFLTKQPQNLPRMFPPNCWVGVSVTRAREFLPAIDSLTEIKCGKHFLSFEPLLENVIPPVLSAEWGGIDWVIIGQCTPGKADTQPRPSWIQNILVAASNGGDIPVFVKDNLAPLLDREWPTWTPRQEWPRESQRAKKEVLNG